MILWLMEWLREYGSFAFPQVFFHFSARMIFASSTALLFSIFLGPRFIKRLYGWKIGQTIRNADECPLLAELHSKKQDTPTMGGVLILFSMAISTLLWMDLRSSFTWILLFVSIGLGILGGIDDYLKLRYRNSCGLSARKKLAGQFFISSIVALYLLCPGFTQAVARPGWCRAPIAKEIVSHHGEIASKSLSVARTQTFSTSEYIRRFYVPCMRDPLIIFPVWVSFIAMVLLITGASNAVNLTDGLDGLAAGCLVMSSLVLGLCAFLSNHTGLASYLGILYIEGSGEIAIFLFTLAGACLGFLWYNSYPAQIFMGDTGSLALGGVLGTSALLLRRELLFVLAGSIFIAEMFSVILQVLSYRYRGKKRLFLCAPLHHHFEYKGWPETKVVSRFWIIHLFFAILAITSLKLQ